MATKREKLLQAVLEEFVKDLRAIGTDTVRSEWPDLYVTYVKAVRALKKKDENVFFCRCDNCANEELEEDLKVPLEQVPKLMERLDVGGEVPAGECSECGALTYRIKD